jgi:hypothetical protein
MPHPPGADAAGVEALATQPANGLDLGRAELREILDRQQYRLIAISVREVGQTKQRDTGGSWRAEVRFHALHTEGMTAEGVELMGAALGRGLRRRRILGAPGHRHRRGRHLQGPDDCR